MAPLLCAATWILLTVMIGPFDRELLGTPFERVSGWLRFRQFVSAPIPEGIFVIRCGCQGTLIDIETRLSFRLKNEIVGEELVRGWKLETHPDYLLSPCPSCQQYLHPSGNGALVLDKKKLTGLFFKNGC